MKAHLKRIVVLTVGWLLILTGLVLSIPLVPGPGFLLVLVGLYVLASHQPWAHRLLERLRRRFPRLADSLDRAAERARAWLHRGRTAPTRE